MCACEIEAVNKKRNVWICLSAYYLKIFGLLHGLCVCTQHVYFDSHTHVFRPACVCFMLPMFASILCMCVWLVCLCRQAGKQQSTTGWWPNSAGLNIKEAECCKCFSQPYSDMTNVTERETEREREEERKREREWMSQRQSQDTGY